VADTSNLSKFNDPKKKEYFMNFVLPETIFQLKSLIKIDSGKFLPAFGDNLDSCTDDGNIIIPEMYRNETSVGDFLIFIGVVDDDQESFLGYATYCIKGIHI
jgi:hypothetical protein